MSHDLVGLGISAQNLTPDQPQLDATPLFQAAIKYAGARHVPYVTVDHGAYYFLSTTTPTSVINIAGINDLTIDLAGSTVWFKEALTQGFHLTACTHVTLENFELDYLTPPYTHVRLTSVDSTGRRLFFATLPRWRDPALLNDVKGAYGTPELWAIAFRNGSIVPGTSRMPVARPITTGVLRLAQDGAPWTQARTLSTLLPGDVIVVTLRGGGGPPIEVFHGDSIVIANGAIYASTNFAVQLSYVSNSTVDHVSVLPRPGSGRLVGSNVDGIHFVAAYRNNAVRNCFVTRTTDDGIIMDSMLAATVAEQRGPRLVRVNRVFRTNFPNGTPVNFVDPVTAQETAGGVIVNQSPPDTSAPELHGPVDITLDRDVSVRPGGGMVYGSDALRGAGSIVEDNTVVDLNLGRRIWIGGNHQITVRRNVVDATSNSGIAIVGYAPGTRQTWPASDSVVVDSNVVRNALGPMASGSGTEIALGAIEAAYLTTSGLGRQPAHAKITISSNYVTDSGRAGIWIGELSGGLVQNNIVTRWSRLPPSTVWGVPGRDEQLIRQDFTQPLAVRFSTGVRLVSNALVPDSPVTQAVGLNPVSVSLSRAAFAGVVKVGPNLTSFNWKAASDSPWLTIAGGGTGTGAGTVSYAVTVNDSGATRTGAITIAGVAFQVTQAALAVAGPTITRQPARAVVSAGETAVFTVAAAGGPVLRYRWQVSSDGQAWTDIADGNSDAGRTVALRIADASPEINGRRFRCVAINASG